MLMREVVKRVRVIETVPAEGIDLTRDSSGRSLKGALFVVGFEVGANGGAVEFETTNPEQPGTLQTIPTPAYTSRPWALKRLGAGTTALPITVLYGAR